MNRLIDPLMTGKKVFVRYTSTGMPVERVNGGWKPDIVPPEQARRAIRLMKEHKLIGNLPPFPKRPAFCVRPALAKRKPVARKPLMVRTVKARVMYTDSDGNKVELEPAFVSMYFDAESAPTDDEAEDEVDGTVSNCSAADSSATITKSEVIGGSVLKCPLVDLGEASQILDENLNHGQDSSATGTIEEVEGGGSGCEIVVNNLDGFYLDTTHIASISG